MAFRQRIVLARVDDMTPEHAMSTRSEKPVDSTVESVPPRAGQWSLNRQFPEAMDCQHQGRYVSIRFGDAVGGHAC